MITPEQIRAARALKGWSQGELAARTGLAVPTIANIEISKQEPSVKTMDKIIDAFSTGGISFTPKGVEFATNEIVSLVGFGKFKNILVDALHRLKDKPEAERTFFAVNAEDILTTDDETALYEEMLKYGIKIKRIVSEKSAIVHSQFETKTINHKYADEKGAFFVFDNKIALYTATDGTSDPSTLIITNRRLADVYRKVFSYMWDTLPKYEATKKSKKAGK